MIRAGTQADIEAAAYIWERAHEKRLGFIPEGARKCIAMSVLASRLALPSTRFYLYDKDGKTAGMLLACQARADDGAGPPVPGLSHISYVAVDPDFWRRGIATKLLEHTARTALTDGFERLQLWVVTDNHRARRLYERAGFHASGRAKVDDYGESIVHYERTLKHIVRTST